MCACERERNRVTYTHTHTERARERGVGVEREYVTKLKFKHSLIVSACSWMGKQNIMADI